MPDPWTGNGLDNPSDGGPLFDSGITMSFVIEASGSRLLTMSEILYEPSVSEILTVAITLHTPIGSDTKSSESGNVGFQRTTWSIFNDRPVFFWDAKGYFDGSVDLDGDIGVIHDLFVRYRAPNEEFFFNYDNYPRNVRLARVPDGVSTFALFVPILGVFAFRVLNNKKLRE